MIHLAADIEGRDMHDGRARVVHDAEGLNTGAPPAALLSALQTPLAAFFTRSHAPPPAIDASAWRLSVGGLVDRPGVFSLDDLATLGPALELDATLVCAGLRRLELLTIAPLPGELPWSTEAVGSGRWRGTALTALLARVGVKSEARHVEFIGQDEVERGGRRFGFGGSISIEKALSGEVLLAHELNGAPLSPAHGFPTRALVPGWIGARSVKWLSDIVLRADPSENYFQTLAYRMQRERINDDPRDVSRGRAMDEIPLNAVILDPEPGSRLAAGSRVIRGWAIGKGGAPLAQIRVSTDDGLSWVPATVLPGAGRWTWTFWEATVELPPGHRTLVVRAEDTAGNRQPASLHEAWNVKGYGNNAWHRVPVLVQDAAG